MPFDCAVFIKPDVPFEREYKKENYAPMFRKKITLDETENAKLYVCGLGFGYYYINGQKVSEDLFTAPVSNYTKTLWYNVYDVSHLLQKGENTFAVICGNGWYNESMSSDWFYHKAPWRDLPKFILRLEIAGKTALVSDRSWKCSPHSAIFFNELRNGEYFDARNYDANWKTAEFNDSSWEYAARDVMPPAGTFRLCACEPVREMQVFPAQSVKQTGKNKYLFDIGQNISGYIRLKTVGTAGEMLTIRYAETVDENDALQLGDIPRPYQEGEMMTDRFICSGEPFVWSPKFTYHGFRYIEIDGLTDIEHTEVSGVFVHQDVKRKTTFSCSDTWLNRLFKAGEYSVYSNMCYQLTDCPTREKLGWTNDAQASTDQILMNFHAELFLTKWYRDILDAQLSDGALPGIIPTSGWGYAWGNGPVSDGVLFEIPYRMYLHTGDDSLLKQGFPFMKRYLSYMEREAEKTGFVSFGLDDWSAPGDAHKTPVELINSVLIMSFYHIAHLAATLLEEETDCLDKAELWKQKIQNTYVETDGACKINSQTAVALLIYFDIYENIEPLKQQLKTLIEQNEYHHDCGMVGIRRLYTALDKCGLKGTAYKILSAEGNPGYRIWLRDGGTTLWERWQGKENPDSKNHHMYSGFMAWMIKTLAGISVDKTKIGKCVYHINPCFIESLQYVSCDYDTGKGNISVLWERKTDGVHLSLKLDGETTVFYQGNILENGEHKFVI